MTSHQEQYIYTTSHIVSELDAIYNNSHLIYAQPYNV